MSYIYWMVYQSRDVTEYIKISPYLDMLLTISKAAHQLASVAICKSNSKNDVMCSAFVLVMVTYR